MAKAKEHRVALQPFIVAEISKSWPDPTATVEDFLPAQFEKVLNRNWDRGYELHSWKLERQYCGRDEHGGERINETLVAVFKLRDPRTMEAS